MISPNLWKRKPIKLSVDQIQNEIIKQEKNYKTLSWSNSIEIVGQGENYETLGWPISNRIVEQKENTRLWVD